MYLQSCRRITGSINIGCLYGETEAKSMGKTNVYDCAGGNGFINKAFFCAKCHVKVYNKPALEVIEGIVCIPVGCFKRTDGLVPKFEIRSEGKLTYLSKSECVLESFEGNGIP